MSEVVGRSAGETESMEERRSQAAGLADFGSLKFPRLMARKSDLFEPAPGFLRKGKDAVRSVYNTTPNDHMSEARGLTPGARRSISGER